MSDFEGRQLPDRSSPPSTSPVFCFYPFADGGVLFQKGTRRLWALNSTSAYIWCMLEQTSEIVELARSMANRFSVEEQRALRDVKDTMLRFEQAGLTGNGVPDPVTEDVDNWDITPHGPTLVEPVRWPEKRLFKTPNHVLEFCCADPELGEIFNRSMEHLSLESEGPVDTRLAVLQGEEPAGTWDIYLNERRYVGGASRNMVLPHLLTLIFVRTCEALHARLLFHAAVLGREGKAVIFPGEAGSGKSTLAATLAAQGYRYFSDELALLNVNSLMVEPFPLPMSIKPGSVEILERYYPGLANSPVHYRTDGKLVRYLTPSSDMISGSEGKPTSIHAFIFPEYREGAGTRLAPISKPEALQRLARTGSSNREFTTVDVRAMLEVVERHPSYELVFSDIDDAVLQLERHVF